MKFNPSNLKLEAWPPAGMRGMRNTVSHAVKVTHTPTGLFVIEKSFRSQYENRYQATLQLEAEVNAYYGERNE